MAVALGDQLRHLSMARLAGLLISVVLVDLVVQLVDIHGILGSVVLQPCPFLTTTTLFWGSVLCQWCPGGPHVPMLGLAGVSHKIARALITVWEYLCSEAVEQLWDGGGGGTISDSIWGGGTISDSIWGGTISDSILGGHKTLFLTKSL